MSSLAHISLAQYELMGEHGIFAGPHYQRVELIRGEIRAMNPIGLDHANAVNFLNEWSYRVLPLDRFLISIQNPIRIPPFDSAPQPDIVWVERKKYHAHPQPAEVRLVIEVSDSTLRLDRGEKADLYAEAGIAEYWVVDCAGKSIEVMRDPRGPTYHDRVVHRDHAEVRPLAFSQAALRTAEVFDQ